MDEEYSYEIQTGRALPEFNADQEVADHGILMEPEVERPVRVVILSRFGRPSCHSSGTSRGGCRDLWSRELSIICAA